MKILYTYRIKNNEYEIKEIEVVDQNVKHALIRSDIFQTKDEVLTHLSGKLKDEITKLNNEKTKIENTITHLRHTQIMIMSEVKNLER